MSDPQSFDWAWLGAAPFDKVLVLQEQIRADLLADAGRDTLLLCEHEPVITLGRSTGPNDLRATAVALRAAGVAVHNVSRGGSATCHGPGQLVGYPVFRLRRGVLAHLEAMAVALISVLGRRGIEARWRRDSPGLWVNDAEGPAKICSFGIHVRHRVAIHGFALNVNNDIGAFAHIVPCGITGCRIASMASLGVVTPSLDALALEVAQSFARGFAFAPSRHAASSGILPGAHCALPNAI